MTTDPLERQLESLADRFVDLERELADPEVAKDGARMSELGREHGELSQIVSRIEERRSARADETAAREMAAESEGDDRELMLVEAEQQAERAVRLDRELRLLLVPKDPLDDKDVIVEIRSAAGGDEAGLFAAELRDMYLAYASRRGWRVEIIDENAQTIGGVRETTFEIKGDAVWSVLKHESGVHRVQRVPATESQGRIHTSTASVAVLPAAEEVDVVVDPNDVRIDTFRASGPGGQSVNTTDSAIRITHLPTGLVVSSQDQKSQHQNKDKAMRVLRSRLLQAEQERAAAERSDARSAQIGSGDRSEKIRTYNFPQSRVTDHRIGLTVHNLSAVMGGELDEVVAVLQETEREARLAALVDGSA